jgi:hypothetical protein
MVGAIPQPCPYVFILWCLVKYSDFFTLPQKSTGVRTFCPPDVLPLEFLELKNK